MKRLTRPSSLAVVLAGLTLSCNSAAPRTACAAQPTRSAAIAAARVETPTPGASGLGDSLMPSSGNGGYDVESYDLTLDYESSDGSIRAAAVIAAKSTQALSSFYLDFHGLEIDRVLVDDEPATFSREEDELLVTPPRPIAHGAEFRTRVEYHGEPEGVKDDTLPIGEKLGWMTRDGEVYVFSQPTGARSVLPCNDHPRDKALFTLRISAPKPLTVVCNGTLADTIDSGERRTFVYKPRDPMATYLMTIAIAEFDEQVIEVPGVPRIVNYFTPQSKKNQRAGFDKTDEVIAFLSETFGAYPFETCGNILSNLRVGGALETQTLPVYGIGANSEDIICHEQAHQWFGDSVSVADWKDIWINEGFSEYAAWMYDEKTRGAEAFEKKLRSMYGIARTTKAKPPGHVTLKSMFGTSVYMRGPLVLHALRGQVGDAAFLSVMRKWCAEHRGGNASIEQFLALVERETSHAAVQAMQPWLYDDEMPHIESWDAQMAADQAARDEKRRQRDEEKRKKKEAEEAAKAAAEKKDG